MDGKVMDEVKEALLTRWRQLGKVLSDTVLVPDEAPSSGAEIIDMAQALEQMGRDSSIQEQERREMQAIEKALAKMATGSFGICEDCNEPIPSKRLLVLPAARLCANCQAYEERQNQRVRYHGGIAR